MIEPTVTVALIGAIQGVGVAVIGAIVSKTNKQQEAYRKERGDADRRREERDAALYSLVFAMTDGLEVLLHQAHGEKLNGNVDEALASIKRAKGAFNKICNENIAKL